MPRLLEREGIAVHFPPGQTCCGQPAYSSGYPDEARAVARRQLGLFPEPWPVVVPSGSCAAMLRHHYAGLFAADPVSAAKAAALAGRVFELTQFLVHVVGFARGDTGEPCTVALHTNCHARREMGVHETSAALLAGLAGDDRAPGANRDAAAGGAFAVRRPDISEPWSPAGRASRPAARRAPRHRRLRVPLQHRRPRRAHGSRRRPRAACAAGEHIASFLWRHCRWESDERTRRILARLRRAPARPPAPDVAAWYAATASDDLAAHARLRTHVRRLRNARYGRPDGSRCSSASPQEGPALLLVGNGTPEAAALMSHPQSAPARQATTGLHPHGAPALRRHRCRADHGEERPRLTPAASSFGPTRASRA
jgi:L-lactate dehydrogenase complex protein LldE